MKTFLVILISAITIFGQAFAQEIQLSLEITMDVLSPSQKDYLQDFRSKIMSYVNDHRWTDVDFYGDKIPVTLSLNFLSGTDAGEFTVQAVVVSHRRVFDEGRPTQNTSLLLRIMDQKWGFTYLKGQPFYHDEFQFNDLTSFLDFYMYIVLGMDFDSMEPLQGTPNFQKALSVAQRSQSSNRASEWQGSQNQYSRMNFLSEIMNAQYEPFRKALYWYYYEGLDFLSSEKEDAQKSIAKALEDIADILLRTNVRSILLTMWLEIKSGEFCQMLNGYPDRPKIMNIMMKADPVRSEHYRKCNF